MPEPRHPNPYPPREPEGSGRRREDDDPGYVRRARNVRKAWNELYPIVLSLVLIGILIAVARNPELRDPSFLSLLGTGLIGLGAYTLKRKRQ